MFLRNKQNTTPSHIELSHFWYLVYVILFLVPLTPLSYFLWDYMKSLIYETTVESEENLLALVGLPGIGDHVCQNTVPCMC